METNTPPALQRVGPLSGVAPLLKEYGVDPAAVFADLQINPEDLEPDNFIPFSQALSLLENCVRLTKLDHFGLVLGSRFDHEILGMVGRLCARAPTLGDALRDYVRAQIGLSRGLSAYLCGAGDCIAFGLGIYERNSPGARQAYGVVMAVAANLVRALTGGKASPVEIHFAHRESDDPSVYQRILKTTVRFNQHQTCLVLPRSAMKAPNPKADARLYREMTLRLHQVLQIGATSVAAQLRHQLRPLLAQGAISHAEAAKALGLHPRTLDRRLAGEETSFTKERNGARFRLAQELLTLTDLPIGDIASALYFSSHANFVRAFHQWSGMTPSEWRSPVVSRERRSSR